MKIITSFRLFESKKNKFPNIKKVNFDDFTIFVGQDAKSNDYLTFNIADDDDIWLHARGIPGSHIVIKVNQLSYTKETKLPSDMVIRKAAELAKKNSKANQNETCVVVWCHRKFVSKLPGMNDGQVKLDDKNLHSDNFITI